jgi:UTP--glucose-1-phosphate uridylyltransferase
MDIRELDPSAAITSAVIAVAGSGTRFLPATKAIPKEMIPILDKPIVQYIVEEMALSGITDVVFVSRWDKKVLEDHFDHHPTLEDELATKGKHDTLAATVKPAELVKSAYVRQEGPYGNGTPAINGGRFVAGDVFVYAFGDDLVSSKIPFTRQLIDQYRKTPGLIIGVQEVDASQVPNYGMVQFSADARVHRIVEKPEPSDVVSNFVSFGRFILPKQIVDILEHIPRGKGNELWLMDAVAEYMRLGGDVYACPIENGRWLTTGDPANYLEALFHYALKSPVWGPHLKRLIREYAGQLS